MRSLLVLLMAACAAPVPSTQPVDMAGPSASVGSFDVMVRNRPTGTFASGDLTSITLRARASEPLLSAFSWVPDDAFGTTTYNGTDFELTLNGGYEINTLLSGLPVFVELETSSGVYTASLGARTRLRSLTGTTLQLDDDLRPVYVDDPVDNLRYRATLTSATPVGSIQVNAARGNAPTVTQVDDTTWHLDWTYTQMIGAGVPGPGSAPIVARSFDGNGSLLGRATARVSVSVDRVAVTDMDPTIVWDNTCTSAVDDCLVQTWGDLGTCGDYRDVQVCRTADVCDLEPEQPLDFGPATAPGLDDALDAWPASCSTGGQWCGLDAITPYMVPRCLDAGTTFEEVVDEVVALGQPQSYHAWAWGNELDAVGLSNHFLFSANYAGGPELLESIYTEVGSRNVMAWNSAVEIPCPNCFDSEEFMVLWFPDVGRVVTLTASFGWDS